VRLQQWRDARRRAPVPASRGQQVCTVNVAGPGTRGRHKLLHLLHSIRDGLDGIDAVGAGRDDIISSNGYSLPSECLMHNAPSSWIIAIIFASGGRTNRGTGRDSSWAPGCRRSRHRRMMTSAPAWIARCTMRMLQRRHLFHGHLDQLRLGSRFISMLSRPMR